MPLEPRRVSRLGLFLFKAATVLGALSLTLAALLATLYFFWVPQFAEEKVRQRLSHLSEKLGQEVSFSHLEMTSADRAVLHRVVLARHADLIETSPDPVVTIPRIEVDVNVLSFLQGIPEIAAVTLIAPHIELIRSSGGVSDLDPLFRLLDAKKSGAPAKLAGASAAPLPQVKVVGGTMRVKDNFDLRSPASDSNGLLRWTKRVRSPIEFVRDIEVDVQPREGLGVGSLITAKAVFEPIAEPLPVTLPREVSITLERTRAPVGRDKGWRAEIDLKPNLIVSRLSALPFLRVALQGLRYEGSQTLVARGVTVTTKGFNAPLLTADETELEISDLEKLQPGKITLSGATFRLETHRDGSSNLETLYNLSRQPLAVATLMTARTLATRMVPRNDRVRTAKAPPQPQRPKWIERLPTALSARDSRLLWVHRGQTVSTWTADNLGLDFVHRLVAQKMEVKLAYRDESGRDSDTSISLGYGEGQEVEAQFDGLDVVSLLHHLDIPGHTAARGGWVSGEVGIIRRQRGGPIRINADIRAHDFGFSHKKVSKHAIEDLDLGVSGRLTWDPLAGDLSLERGRVVLENTATLRFNLAMRGVGHGRPRAALPMRGLSFDLGLDDTEAQAIFDAVPAALKAEVKGMKFRGKVGFDFSTKIDPMRIDRMQNSSDFRLTDFDIVSYNKATDVRMLNHDFVHEVVQPETGYHFRIQADSDRWVPLRRVSPYVIKALRTNEDGSFYSHSGFSWKQIRATVAQNIKARRVVRGASTVSMQLVKNIYLSHERTAARKLQEALLTFAMEQVEDIPKNRILEAYLNIVEWGPNVYGIRSAARHYFNRNPRSLNVGESVFLISILPNPRRFHQYKERGYISDHWWARMQRLIDVMLERKHIDEEKHAEAMEKRPRFRTAQYEDPSEEDGVRADDQR